MLKASPRKDNARQFLDFMLTNSFQKEIPLGNWMLPAVKISLPMAMKKLQRPLKIIQCPVPSAADMAAWSDMERQQG
jgi:thiamine transport system substrate-binding protein